MDGTIFFWVGGALVVAALALSFVGIREKGSFPPSRPAFTAVIGLFALLVAVTGAFAVANAREEQEHREKELAHEAEEAAEDAGALEQEGSGDAGASSQAQQGEEGRAAGPGGGQPAGGGGGETLDITSPDDGSLSFEPDGLEAQAGTITLAYENPSQVPHNVAIEDEGGQVLGEGETLAQGTSEASAELAPGEYTFFCAVPGHREGGMEGTLTVSQ